MHADRYDLPLSTASAAARDAYAQGYDLALTLYPGALEAFDRALAADPGFALAHAGKAQVLMREGKAVAARAALAVAKDVAAGLEARETGHIGFFDLAFAGRTDAAIAALQTHLTAWPRDALMVASAANPNGLIGGSGRIGQKHQIALLMDNLAPHYGDDYWFLAYHATALSEDGQLAAARPKIERSVALNPNNAHAAHGFAHVCYESDDADTGRGFLSSWLASYPRDGAFHGHLSWHLALFELGAGDWPQALRLYQDAIAVNRHSGGPQQKMTDGAAFLWRSELAGHPRDAAAWRALHEYGNSALPRPGAGLADLHVILTQAVMGDDAALDARTRQMEELAREGRYPSGAYLPALSRGFVAFERRDFPAALEQLQDVALFGDFLRQTLAEYPQLQDKAQGRRLLYEVIRRMLSAQVYDVIAATRRALDVAAPASVDAVRQLAPLLQFGPDMREKSQVLKAFLLQQLYRHPQVMRTMGQATQVVHELFAAYLEGPQEMGDGFLARADAARGAADEATTRARVVADYIAGMTDRFAAREHERLTGHRLLS